jgi:hypothetical protein
MGWVGGRHYPSLLSPDIQERLAALGIDPEASTEAWLQAIRDGSFPLSSLGRPDPGRMGRDTQSPLSPGARLVPIPIPLALVLPDPARQG